MSSYSTIVHRDRQPDAAEGRPEEAERRVSP